jgi:hypothetical protein
VKELATLQNLETLYLSGTKVTDAGIKELVALKNLTGLYLWETKVTDTGLKDLAALKKLTFLSIFNTKVTGAGVKEFQKALPSARFSTDWRCRHPLALRERRASRPRVLGGGCRVGEGVRERAA